MFSGGHRKATPGCNGLMSSKGSDKKHLLHSMSNNEEMMTGFDTEELIEEIFESHVLGIN